MSIIKYLLVGTLNTFSQWIFILIMFYVFLHKLKIDNLYNTQIQFRKVNIKKKSNNAK